MNLGRRHVMRAASTAIAYAAMLNDAGGQTSTAVPPAQLSPAQMREDLVYLQMQWGPLDQSYSDRQRVIFKQVIEEAITNTATSSMADFALDVKRAAAVARNGHTEARADRILGPGLPIRTWWFSDGLFITKAPAQFAYLVGARVEKFGPLAPEQAMARVAPFISGTDQRVRYQSALYLVIPTVLRRIGVTTDVDQVVLGLRLRDGSASTATLGPASVRDPGGQHELWSALAPDDMTTQGRWLHVLDGVAQHSPAYDKATDVSMRWMGDDNRILYLRSNQIADQDQSRLDRKLIGILQRNVVPKQPRSVIVDLRFNDGGNFFDTILFSQALPKIIPKDGRIFVLVGRSTFSAAIATAAMIKGAGQDKVTFIGETMGDNGHFWAEPGTSILPNSKIAVAYATKFEDYEQGCDDLDKCYWATAAFGPKGISLRPDIEIDLAFSDYAEGRDPILAKAVSLTT